MLNSIWDYVFKNYDLNEEEKNKVRYVLTSFMYDFSKFLIIGCTFFILGRFKEFLMCAVLMFFIRPGIGGFHFRHYISCLLFSFSIIGLSVAMAEYFSVSKAACLVILAVSLTIFGLTEPVSTAGRSNTPKNISARLKLQNFVKIGIYLLAVYIFPFSSIFVCGTFLILLLALQLAVAHCAARGFYHAAICHLFSLCLFLFDYIRFSKVSIIFFGEPEYYENHEGGNTAKIP